MYYGAVEGEIMGCDKFGWHYPTMDWKEPADSIRVQRWRVTERRVIPLVGICICDRLWSQPELLESSFYITSQYGIYLRRLSTLTIHELRPGGCVPCCNNHCACFDRSTVGENYRTAVVTEPLDSSGRNKVDLPCDRERMKPVRLRDALIVGARIPVRRYRVSKG